MSTILVKTTTGYLELNTLIPRLEAQTTAGLICLTQCRLSGWVNLLSRIADLSLACSTKLIEFAKRQNEFRQKNVEFFGYSIEHIYSHIVWLCNLQNKSNVKIDFPIIAGLDKNFSSLYGMTYEFSSIGCMVERQSFRRHSPWTDGKDH